MVTFKSSVLILIISSVSGQFAAYYQYNPQARSSWNGYPYQRILSLRESSLKAQSDNTFTTEEPSTAATNDNGDAEDEDCITATFKTGANYLWDFAKNNATLHCKIGTADLATKFDEYASKVGVYSGDELEVFLKEAKGHIAKSFHRALTSCQDEITRFNYFFEYEVCVPCGFKC